MALDIKKFSGNLGAGGTTRFFTYLSSNDDRAAVEAAGFFNDMYQTLRVGDTILINSLTDSVFLVIVTDTNVAAKTVVIKTTMSEGGA